MAGSGKGTSVIAVLSGCHTSPDLAGPGGVGHSSTRPSVVMAKPAVCKPNLATNAGKLHPHRTIRGRHYFSPARWHQTVSDQTRITRSAGEQHTIPAQGVADGTGRRDLDNVMQLGDALGCCDARVASGQAG
jgi:hypothetical protein